MEFYQSFKPFILFLMENYLVINIHTYILWYLVKIKWRKKERVHFKFKIKHGEKIPSSIYCFFLWNYT